MQDPTQYCLDRLSGQGFDKSQVRYSIDERDELQAEHGKTSLFRTVANTSLVLTGIHQHKRATVTLNSSDQAEIDRAVDALWLSAQASMADEANDIAGQQAPDAFSEGLMTPDRDAMFGRLEEFLAYSQEQYPTVLIGLAGVSHLRKFRIDTNSNGVRFESSTGCYQTSAHFSAKDGLDVSSMNGSYALTNDLDTPIAELATFDRLLRGAAEQVRTQKVEHKFTGDLVITPDCVGSFFGFLINSISRGPMVAGTSIYKDKLGETVASDRLNLRSMPRSKPGGYQVTEDCFPAQDLTVVEDGVLRSYLLDLYAANKTGLERSGSTGGWYSVDPGTTSLHDLIKHVDQGILIGRFSGGQPSSSGDFSGIAKNSYYIENGDIKHPISETMVSGNMANALLDICDLSVERADFGMGAFPWVRTSGVTVS